MRKLGYVAGKHVNLYGEHMVLVSDPFADGECIAVRAVSASDPTERKIDLPLSILAGWEDLFLEPVDPTASKPDGVREPGETRGGSGGPAGEQDNGQQGREKSG
jgi:hypothetical protein